MDDFRQEARRWIIEHAPKSLYGTRSGRFDGHWGGRNPGEIAPDVQRWLDLNVERGWTAPDWPAAYGGGGLTRRHAEVINDLLVELKLPPPLVGFGLAMIGPTLLHYGSEAQREEHLPKIVRGDIRWCQGYSEPAAGSDLAALRTSAVLDGDEFVVSGQKVWTSHADKADWIFALVRTDPDAPKKQAGITFLLIDMASAGVQVEPILLISGASPFCETFFEDVRVPRKNVVGEIDGGWTVAKALLGFERSMIGAAIGGQLRPAEAEMVELARRSFQTPEGPLGSETLRQKVAEWAIDAECFHLTIQRVVQQMKSGQAPGSESSILKVVGAELKQRRWDLAMEILGPDSAGWAGGSFEASDLQMTRDWLRSRGNSIEGGTS